MPTAKQRHDEELHEALVAVDAVAFATGEVVGLPLLEPEFKPLSATLGHIGQSLGSGQVAVQVAPKVR